MGLMQLIPQTAQPLRRAQRLRSAAEHPRRRGLPALAAGVLRRRRGRWWPPPTTPAKAAVDRHRGVPPFDETREYVRRVVARFGNAPQPFDAQRHAPVAADPHAAQVGQGALSATLALSGRAGPDLLQPLHAHRLWRAQFLREQADAQAPRAASRTRRAARRACRGARPSGAASAVRAGAARPGAARRAPGSARSLSRRITTARR